ncbi:MAG TPA: hypothetical protein VGP94_00980 [Tepidisphaeraceae bacterium]|jgi:hypothetical protein|nr:hypothetical protein [Tepidisphaeraceae bacterium]
MKNTKSIILIALFILAAANPALAQKQPKPERIYHLKITPMSPERPAMKYRLLPSSLDTVPGNAAQLYMIGATQAPTDDAFNNQIDSWLSMDITALPRQEIEAKIGTTPIGYIFKNFDSAARREQCVWENHYKTQGFEALLPHLRGIRDGSRIVALKARLQIADGDYPAALHTLQTGMATSRHLTPQSVLIQQLVGAAVARYMLNDLTEWVGSSNAPNLYWALAELPHPYLDLRDTFDQERFGFIFSFPPLRDVDKGLTVEQWQQVMDKLPQMLQWDDGRSEIRKAVQLGPAVFAIRLYPLAKKYYIDRGMAPVKVEAMPVHQILAKYLVDSFQEESDEVLKWQALPYWQAQEPTRAAEEAAARAQAKGEAGPLGWMVPAVSRARLRLVLIDRYIASLQCVEGIRAYAAIHNGNLPDSLVDLVDTPAPLDPVTNQPFPYEVNANVAMLSAPIPAGGNPDQGWRFEISVAK